MITTAVINSLVLCCLLWPWSACCSYFKLWRVYSTRDLYLLRDKYQRPSSPKATQQQSKSGWFFILFVRLHFIQVASASALCIFDFHFGLLFVSCADILSLSFLFCSVVLGRVVLFPHFNPIGCSLWSWAVGALRCNHHLATYLSIYLYICVYLFHCCKKSYKSILSLFL